MLDLLTGYAKAVQPASTLDQPLFLTSGPNTLAKNLVTTHTYYTLCDPLCDRITQLHELKHPFYHCVICILARSTHLL